MRRLLPLGRLARPSLFAALALAVSFTAQAAVITVDSGTDDGVGCTLREAVEAANTNTAVGGCAAGDNVNDEIQFSVGAVTLTGGQLYLSEDLVVTGPVTLTATPGQRIVRVGPASSVSFSGVTFVGGRGNGGALAITAATTVTVTGGAFNQNNAPLSGGAIYLSATGTLTIDGTSFTDNQARGDAANQGGGAIYTNGGGLTVQNATFTNNRALGTSGSGGAILSPNGASLNIQASTFTNNRSERAGGAIETVGGATMVTGGSFVGNTAGTNPGNGGAIHGGGTANVTVTDAAATGNRASEGGAYWISASGTLSLFGVTVTGNIAEGASADQGGGGVYVDGGVLNVDSGTGDSVFSGNRASGASGSGGAILVNGGSATVFSTTFEQNRSQRAGGAVEVTAPGEGETVLTAFVGSTFTQNVTGTAPGNGGAIHTTQGVITLQVLDASVSNNEAGNEGGGLWINGGTTLLLRDSNLLSNAARGAAGGGGLFVNGGEATVLRTTLSGNRTFGQGSAGGGVHLADGTATLDQTLLLSNSSDLGGGLAVRADASATVQNSTLYDNSARLGGGVVSLSGAISFDSATIASNSASLAGGGLYNQNTQNAGTPFVTFTNSIVADNSATNGANLSGRYGSGGWNVIGTTPTAATFPATGTDQTGTDPMLDALADNGGPTLTAALQSGSPAIDAGSTDLTIDQRGVARTEPDDVGAVEFGDAAAGPALVFTGIFDGNLTGGLPKAIEVYVLDDIADLSVYGLGSANNGGGTDGQEFTFPAVAASAGDYIYIASETTGFTSFFGFAPDYTSSAAGNNGDDAIELFQDGAVVDIFGDIDTDGTGQPWEYEDGWVYRKDGTGPDGTTFVLNNFTYSGPQANDDDTTQGSATNPWPIGTYSPVLVSAAPFASATQSALTLDALTVVPNPFRSSARATFAVSEAQAVSVTLYDVMGRQVQQVFSGAAQAEQAIEVSVDGSSLAAGVYVLVLQGETVRSTRQVTVAR